MKSGGLKLKTKKTKRVVAFFLLICMLSVEIVRAQVDSSGFAVSIPLSDSQANDGDIVCSHEDGFKLCDKEYDPEMYGVLVSNVSVLVEDRDLANSRLALTTGVAKVKVTASGGNISEGDFITSSETPGVGRLAEKNGYVLGTALTDFQPANSSDVGEIQISLHIHPAAGLTGPGSNLLQFIREGLVVPLIEPLESLRYILAVLMVIISFTLGMVYFGRSTRAGIEAVGRNPLAKRVIQFTVVMNVVLTIVIVLVGLGIAYMILVL